MKTKKLLSILMALMMILSVVPFYASAEAVALTTTNVTEWPTVTYLNPDGKMYFGQTVGEGIALTGGKVEYNGVQVPGHFEHIDPNQVVTTPGTARVNMKFVPDDTNAFSGFEKKRSADCKYTITTTQPLYVDEVNDPVVASEVEPGATLSTSVLSGGKMYNPYNINETKISTATWSWTDSTVVVTESGYYEAVFYPVGYVRTTAQVYVKVKSNALPTEIVELPTATVTYGTKWNELILEGGKVMTKDTNEEVEGSFVIDNVGSSVIGVGIYTPNITFIPNDTEKYLPCVGTATVTVTKANYKFVNENGEEVTVPEITLPYGTTFNTGEALGVTLKLMIKDRNLLSGADAPFISFPDHDTEEIAPVGTNTYTVRIYPSHEGNSNYQTTYRQFVLTIEPVTVEVKASSAIGAEVKSYKIDTVDSYAPYPQGTFDVYIDGALYMEDVKGSFPFDPGKSGEYEIRMVYNPVENDPCVVPEKIQTITETYTRNLKRSDNILGGTPTVMYGKEVKLSANIPEENFGGWRITDANGNEVVLEDAVMEGRDITFTMPDFDITVEAIDKTQSSGDGSGSIDNIFGNLGDLTEGDSESKLVNIINNLIAFIRNIIEKITGFFRAIGDAT